MAANNNVHVPDTHAEVVTLLNNNAQCVLAFYTEGGKLNETHNGTFAALAAQFVNITFVRVSADRMKPDVEDNYNVKRFPTFVLFQGGNPVASRFAEVEETVENFQTGVANMITMNFQV